ncbi:ExbD/TolR family protein [Thalassoroseus pseudoceratinae]|uniref:ExbD/TolR family protein n=1 Tax=Thalassoroseus pseudoceratinae TaxID=2713176 RepID=UPI0014215CD6
MRCHNRQSEADQRPFTALIDVVFLLLVFFMLTLKIVEPEGKLTVEAGPTIASPPTFPTNLPINVRLESSSNGSLTDVRLARRSLGADKAGIERLRTEMQNSFQSINPRCGMPSKRSYFEPMSICSINTL